MYVYKLNRFFPCKCVKWVCDVMQPNKCRVILICMWEFYYICTEIN